jgi:Ni,Fe-hydrogenase III large subunit
MDSANPLILHNGQSADLHSLPVLSVETFREWTICQVEAGGRLAAMFDLSPSPVGGLKGAGSGDFRLIAVVARDRTGDLALMSCRPGDQPFASITPDCPAAHLFERELAEQGGVKVVGHPWLKPVRFPDGKTIGQTDFFRVEGDEVHEVAVGPVHAGVIEPGHFRFQCHGETVFHLEISLGYQHRGVERAMRSVDPKGPTGSRAIHYMETLAGDTTIGHASAYCQLVEGLAGANVPLRALTLRGVALELERMANHIGDLGALAGDVGYLPTASFCGRIRGDVLNMTAELCGNRFGRGLVRPGGVAFDVDEKLVEGLLARLDAVAGDTANAVDLLWNTSSVMARFEGTGVLPLDVCESLGAVGPAARACGADRDVRRDLPAGIYRFTHIPPCTWTGGDVFARAWVRWLEVQHSISFIRQQLTELPAGDVGSPLASSQAERIAVSLVEGWRGEICHVAVTDSAGRFSRYKVVDPSFHNWACLAYTLRDQQISDFPLCNKSFNLSYCGHDL